MKINKKVASILFLAVVVIMLIVNLVFFSKDDKQAEKQAEEKVEETTAAPEEVEEKDPLEETKKAITRLYRDKITPIGTGKEYPAEKTGILKKELLGLAEEGAYGELLQKANSLTNDYSFSEGDNLDIAGIIYDAGLIADVYGTDIDKMAYGEVVASSVTPDMLVASTLWSDNFSRRPIIEDVNSLSPIGYDNFTFNGERMYRNAKEAEDEQLFDYRNIVEEIFTFHEDASAVYVYDVELPNDGGLPLTVYVWEDLFGTVSFYGMYAPDDFKTYEQTLAWWMEKDIFYENAEEQQDKNYEQNAEDGIITNEQIDKLFESGY